MFLIDIMPLMFIPGSAGLINIWPSLKPVLIPLLVMTLVSTVLVMAVSAKVTEFVIKFDKKVEKEEKQREEKIREEIYRILVENKVSKSQFNEIVRFINVCYDGKAFFEKEEA